MAVPKPTNVPLPRFGTQLVDLVVTLILWAYFIFGFLFFFVLLYLIAYLFSKNRELAFQRLHHIYYRVFFKLAKAIIPRHSWHIDTDILKIRSSVIICNHVSYLDPLIMISLFERHKTIVKTRFFHVPIFSWLMKTAGYLPSTTDEKFSYQMINQIEQMAEYLRQGGNLIIFPEGTRNSAEQIGPLNNGALKIARL
nr:1-acyl-sn-glycerol-3-phosphate acyltransferase [Desulfobulbaceae bacterium]